MPCPSDSGHDALTEQFYAWERRGRGWQHWNRPVTLEPPFRPFFGHYLTESIVPIGDDARKPTALSSFFDRLKAPTAPPPPRPTGEIEPDPEYAEDGGSLIEIEVALPADIKTTKDAAGQFLLSLGHVARPMSFEIVGTTESVLV